MPLVACPNCRAEISDAAPACIHCGWRNAAASAGTAPRPAYAPPPPPRKGASIPGWALALLIGGGLFMMVVVIGIAAAIVIPRLANSRSDGPPPEAVEFEEAAPVEPVVHRSEVGPFALRVDPTEWRLGAGGEPNPDAEFEFQHASGEAFALVISERVGMTLPALRRIALENLQAEAPDGRVVREETRTVDGREVLSLVMDATVDGIPIRYHGYYYSGNDGTLQVLTFTTQNLYEDLRGDIEAFLNGLEFSDAAGGGQAGG